MSRQAGLSNLSLSGSAGKAGARASASHTAQWQAQAECSSAAGFVNCLHSSALIIHSHRKNWEPLATSTAY